VLLPVPVPLLLPFGLLLTALRREGVGQLADKCDLDLWDLVELLAALLVLPCGGLACCNCTGELALLVLLLDVSLLLLSTGFTCVLRLESEGRIAVLARPASALV
jgi:hypothetical protein